MPSLAPGCGFPGMPGVVSCKWQLGGNLGKRLGMTFPGWPTSALMCQALCHPASAWVRAWEGHRRLPQGVPGTRSPPKQQPSVEKMGTE